jgi:hypothetical protein
MKLFILNTLIDCVRTFIVHVITHVIYYVSVYLYYCYIYCFVRTHVHLYSRTVVLFVLFRDLL